MGLPNVSEMAKAWIFYGAAILWTVWGIVDYFFSFAFPIFLGLMILVLIGWIVLIVKGNSYSL